MVRAQISPNQLINQQINQSVIAFSISNLHHLEKTSQCLGLSDKLLDYSGDFVKACIQGIINLLHQALGKRLLLLDIRLEPCPKVSLFYSGLYF